MYITAKIFEVRIKYYITLRNISSRFFENQDKEICCNLSEKASKGRFLKPEKLHPRKFGNHETAHRPTDRPTDRPPARPSVPQAYQFKIIQSTGMATQMQLKVFGKKSHGRLLERKNDNKVVSFSTLFLMFKLM